MNSKIPKPKRTNADHGKLHYFSPMIGIHVEKEMTAEDFKAYWDKWKEVLGIINDSRDDVQRDT